MKYNTKKIETERLILRKFKLSDYKYMFNNWASCEEVAKNAGWPKHEKMSDTKELVQFWIDEYKNENIFNWIIELKDKEPIGSITVVRNDMINRTCEIGYNIGKEYWGNGYATEAIKYVVDYLFNTGLFDTIIAQCFEFNIPSIKVLENNRFIKEGILRNRYIIDNKKVNLVVASLLKEDYYAKKD